MTLGSYLTLDQGILYNGNFSSDSSLRVTGTLYTDPEKTTPFVLTGYTLTMRIHRDHSTVDLFNQTCTINSATAGTFYINIADNTLPSTGYTGVYLVDVVLTKSGTRVTNLNRVEILIQRGPTD